MSSPYRAHFDLRKTTLWLVFAMVANALASVAAALLWDGPVHWRAALVVLGAALLVVAWGVHLAREWARVCGIVLCLLGPIGMFLAGREDFEKVFFFVLIAIWLALPSTKGQFAAAREMIRRTAEIGDERERERAAVAQSIAERRRESTS